MPIQAMPGVVQHTRDTLRKAAVEALEAGGSGIMLFGVPEDVKKDAAGTAGTDPDGMLQVAIRDVRAEVGDELVIMSDLCLDVLAKVAESVDVPVAAYQVSGEYAMVEAAAEKGWIDRDKAVLETFTGIRRAGAQLILTYWATEVARRLSGGA